MVVVGDLRLIVQLWDLNLLMECPPWRVFLRDPTPYFPEFRRKTTENSERLCRQVRPGFKLGTSRLPALSAVPLRHWWGTSVCECIPIRWRVACEKKRTTSIKFQFLNSMKSLNKQNNTTQSVYLNVIWNSYVEEKKALIL